MARSRQSVICANAHPLTARGFITLESLRGYDFVDLTRERRLRTLVDEIFMQHQLERATAFEINDEPTAVQFVEQDLGVAIFPRRLANMYSKSRRITVLPLGAPDLAWEVKAMFACQPD